MRKFVSALCAGTLAAAVAVTGVMPVSAAPAYVPKVEAAQQSDVVHVQDWRRKNWKGNRHWNGPRHAGRRHGHGWYNGHRGYRHRRPGYRYHDGWWFPAGAFVAGAIIGGALNNSQPVYRGGGNAHVQWCYNRYRSYRAYDNTFQPYNGPRRQCYSPYS